MQPYLSNITEQNNAIQVSMHSFNVETAVKYPVDMHTWRRRREINRHHLRVSLGDKRAAQDLAAAITNVTG